MHSKVDHLERIIFEHPWLYRKPVDFECQNGWLDLIERLSDNLEAQIEDFRRIYSGDEIPMCTTIKQDAGKLRFILNLGTQQMWEDIDEAESLSLNICEICGKKGKMHQAKYPKVRCDKHINR